MYGAVLWSDQCTNRALIWCEDHGNLAFFDGAPDDVCAAFEEGDLVTFKVRDGRGMRLAFEVEMVAADEYPSLAEGLRGISSDHSAQSLETPERKILPFRNKSSGSAQHDTRTSNEPFQHNLLLQSR